MNQHDDFDSSVDILSLFPQDDLSKSIMNRRTLAIADKFALQLASCELHARNKYISFNLNKDSYCIELSYIKEVLKDASITRVPGIPDYIEGIMNLRGDYITEMFEFLEDELPEFGDGYFSNEFIYNETLYTVLNVDKITSDKRIIITDM